MIPLNSDGFAMLFVVVGVASFLGVVISTIKARKSIRKIDE